MRRGLPMDQFFAQDGGATNRRGEPENPKLDAAHYEAMLREDMNMDEASEEVAVQLAAQGVIGKKVDQMESGFMMALDYMIQIAEKDQDDKTMESHPVVPDRKLLVRLVLIREEARNMMAGGILDERNDHGLNILPKSEVRDELEQLLDDYDDMEDLYLSRKLAGA
ncbi:Hypothetical predicted protein [Olea europaea subsp. europaea]|uniref:Uncharacterized protein n=1 Tax=Olea europaea subsp. europaea TaxID=158383 RepID=A0A8S0RM43_OLEEU|nr:Hypothetical predicted protein [Olea europaea subsp. europaea]